MEWEGERIPELECKFEVRVSSRVSSGTEFQSWSESEFQICSELEWERVRVEARANIECFVVQWSAFGNLG